jgi:F-type H+-transporting ATPase subunit epsilon
MATTFHCDIVSAEEAIFSGTVEMLIAAGTEGDLGVEAGHTPLLTGLQPGPVRVQLANGSEEIYYVSGGYLEVQPHVVTILADTALRAGDMDEAAAVEAKKAAEKDLFNKSTDVDYTRAATQLAEAAAQLRTLQAMRKRTGR